MLGIREGLIHFFRSKNFCLRLPKNFVGEPFCAVFHKISGVEEIYGEEGVPGFPAEKFLSRSAEKIHRGTHSCFTPLGIDKFYASEG